MNCDGEQYTTCRPSAQRTIQLAYAGANEGGVWARGRCALTEAVKGVRQDVTRECGSAVSE